jgi:hypothetical protein
MNLKRCQGQRRKVLESGTFIINSRNKSEAKAEEGANPTTLKLLETDLNACLTNPITRLLLSLLLTVQTLLMI